MQNTGISSIRGLEAIADHITREYNAEFAWPQFRLFLAVASRCLVNGPDYEGLPMQEAVRILGMSQGAVSRNFKELSKYAPKNKAATNEETTTNNTTTERRGYNLLTAIQNPYNRLQWNMILTDKGRELCDTISSFIKECES